jgi:hypothetical protein
LHKKMCKRDGQVVVAGLFACGRRVTEADENSAAAAAVTVAAV